MVIQEVHPMTREWWSLPSTMVSADLIFVQAHLTSRGGQHSCLSLRVSLVILGAPVSRVQAHNPCVPCLCAATPLFSPATLSPCRERPDMGSHYQQAYRPLLLRLGELSHLLLLECSVSPSPEAPPLPLPWPNSLQASCLRNKGKEGSVPAYLGR